MEPILLEFNFLKNFTVIPPVNNYKLVTEAVVLPINFNNTAPNEINALTTHIPTLIATKVSTIGDPFSLFKTISNLFFILITS